MGSKSTTVDQTSTNTTAVSLSRDAITESGTQILDSVIIDPSDETMKALIGSLGANFEVLVSGQKAGLGSLLDMGSEVLDLVNRNLIGMETMAQNTLRQSVEWLKEQQEMGRNVIDLSANVADRGFDFAGNALDANSSALQRALDITADIKTGDFTDTLKSMTVIVTVFAAVAIWLAKGK